MSSTIERVPFKPGHLLLIGTRMSDLMRDHIAMQAQYGTAWTLLVDGRVAVCFGATEIWQGLGEVWMVISDLARSKPVALFKAMIDAGEYTVQSLRLRRLQCHVKTSDRRAIRFAEAFGFQKEATLRKYGDDGSDYDLMAMVR